MKESTCHECKHPIKFSIEAPLIQAAEVEELDLGFVDEDALKADRLLKLASLPPDDMEFLCNNCLSRLSELLESKIRTAKSQNEQYERQLAALEAQIQNDQSGIEDNEELEQQLHDVRIEEKAQSREFAYLQQELEKICNHEEVFWGKAAELELKLLDFEEDNSEVGRRTIVAVEELDLLQRTNVINDLFFISSCDQFGTISGLRLGRLDTEMVPWDEINAAWGQCVLLLGTLMRLIGFTSAKAKLFPLGSFSRIAPITDTTDKFELQVLNSFCSDTQFTRMITRFNEGQKLYLETLHEFAIFAESQIPGLVLPYKIQDDMIGSFSIALEISHKEKWTRALRFMLQTLKTLLVWCVRD